MSVEPVAAMAAALSGALRLVDGVRHQEFLGDDVDPPATVLLPPTLTWEAYVPEPTAAVWQVALVVPADERALALLWALRPRVTAALDDVMDVAVIRAEPGTFPVGSVELPAYLITLECGL
ncbi:MAG: hypothetical protein AB7I06_18505 [Burkholderiales bacterium]